MNYGVLVVVEDENFVKGGCTELSIKSVAQSMNQGTAG